MKKINKILIVSTNPHKINKLKEILIPFFEIIDTQESLSLDCEVEETGNTFQENAEIKALAFSNVYNGYTIATDGGIDIPALDSWNGLYTKRFAGENVDDFFRMDSILEKMKFKKNEEREMVWREAVVIALNGEIIHSETVDGIKGLMQKEYNKNKYRKGIWLCSLFYFPQFKKNFFDLTSSEVEKAEVSWLKIGKICKKIFL